MPFDPNMICFACMKQPNERDGICPHCGHDNHNRQSIGQQLHHKPMQSALTRLVAAVCVAVMAVALFSPTRAEASAAAVANVSEAPEATAASDEIGLMDPDLLTRVFEHDMTQDFEFAPYRGYQLFRKGGKYGLKDASGTVIEDAVYDSAFYYIYNISLNADNEGCSYFYTDWTDDTKAAYIIQRAENARAKAQDPHIIADERNPYLQWLTDDNGRLVDRGVITPLFMNGKVVSYEVWNPPYDSHSIYDTDFNNIPHSDGDTKRNWYDAMYWEAGEMIVARCFNTEARKFEDAVFALDGEQIPLPFSCIQLSVNYDSPYLLAELDIDRNVFLDSDLQNAIGQEFRYAGPFSEGMAYVCDDSGPRYIDENGIMQIKLASSIIDGDAIINGKAFISGRRKLWLIDKSGKHLSDVFPLDFNGEPLLFSTTTDPISISYSVGDDRCYYFLDMNGELIAAYID